MPLNMFSCPACGLVFQARTQSPSQETISCQRCKAPASKQSSLASFGISRVGMASETMDHAVGSAAQHRWEEIQKDREIRDQVRSEIGSHAVTQLPDGTYTAISEDHMKLRKQAYEPMNETGTLETDPVLDNPSSSKEALLDRVQTLSQS